jgi:hypothetical protein
MQVAQARRDEEVAASLVPAKPRRANPGPPACVGLAPTARRGGRVPNRTSKRLQRDIGLWRTADPRRARAEV